MTKVAVVTGASRGLGRGVAIALADAGFTVFATGRTIENSDLPAGVIRLRCDHRNDEETATAFARVKADAGRLDILVNSAWGGYERMVEAGVFTWTLPFHEQPAHRWAGMMDAGGVCLFAARGAHHDRPAPRILVNISFWAARNYIGNVIYGLAKAAMDKMTADIAHELQPHDVATVSLYPGLVRTEAVLEAARQGWLDLSNSESPAFSGRVIAALYGDAELMIYSGRVVVAAEAAADTASATSMDAPTPLTLEKSERMQNLN